jgi:hypothetical protein
MIVKTIIRTCLIGVLIATLCLFIDAVTQIKREIWIIIIRYAGMIVLSVLIHQYRKLERFLPNTMAKEASFKLWVQCVIVLGLLYIGIGYGLFLAIFITFIILMPFLNNDVFQIIFDIYRITVILGFLFGNGVYITCVLK